MYLSKHQNTAHLLGINWALLDENQHGNKWVVYYIHRLLAFRICYEAGLTEITNNISLI